MNVDAIRTPSSSQRSRLPLLIAVAVAVQIGAQFLLFGWTTGEPENEWTTRAPEDVWTVVIVRDWVVVLGAIACVSAWIRVALQTRRERRFLLLALYVSGAVALWCVWGLVGASWTVVETQEMAGNTCALLRRRQLFRADGVLVTPLDVGLFTIEAPLRDELFVASDSISVLMVRPESMLVSGNLMQSTRDGWMLVMSSQYCRAGFNHSTGETFLKDRRTPRISPFALVDRHERCAAADVDELVKVIGSGHAYDAGSGFISMYDALPRDADLLFALDSPNLSIQEAAARMIQAGGQRMYPDATARLRARR